jgi:hypothetical protein
MDIVDILLTPFDEINLMKTLETSEHFKKKARNRIWLSTSEEFMIVLKNSLDDFAFRLWIHPGIKIPEPNEVEYWGETQWDNIKQHQSYRNMKCVFVTREPDFAKRRKLTENTNSICIYHRDLNEPDFNVDEIPINIKSDLLQSFVEFKAKTSEKYIAGDPYSAIDKAKKVLQVLSEYQIDLTDYIFVSLGGGDGSELLYEIEKSPASLGCMIEYDGGSIDRFDGYVGKEDQFPNWIAPKKVEFLSREADLFDKIKFNNLKDFVAQKKPNGVIITIHAVLHELKTRSQLKEEFNLQEFFDRIATLHENIIIIIREPGIAENWPTEVRIKISNKKLLNSKAKFIRDYLKSVKEKNNSIVFLKILEILKEKYFPDRTFSFNEEMNIFLVSNDLATEALTKLFYLDDFFYEIDEHWTSISRENIQKALVNAKFKVLESEAILTSSIRENFKKYEISVFEDNEEMLLPRPLCFSYTIASKGIHKRNR